MRDGSGLIELESRATPEPAPDLLRSYPEFFARVLAARGITSLDNLDLSLSRLIPPDALSDIDVAAARIARAIQGDQKILVLGDFDADGAAGTALAVSLLESLGASRVDYLVPNRFQFGYGLTPEIVHVALEREPSLIVTVDNGMSSVAGVTLAQDRGVDVVVTDHHLPGEQLPPACAIVNPNAPGCEFASKSLAGVGVVYYVLSRVRTLLADDGFFPRRNLPPPRLADWLDLVALGTVADVAPLDLNNRILVHQGLRRMRFGHTPPGGIRFGHTPPGGIRFGQGIRFGHTRPGIRALAQVAGRNLRTVTAQDLGFGIAPRLNAAGRLSDMTLGIRCLLSLEMPEAQGLARELDQLNTERRAIERDMTLDAALLVDESAVDQRGAICLYDASWHQGIVGIVAGRIRERHHRPVIAFADSGAAAPGELRGSARSIPGLHIRDALDDVAVRFPGLMVKFGGHAMAAGLSIKRSQLERFTKAFSDAVGARVSERDLAGIRLTDGELEPRDLVLENARLIARHGPWGHGFEEPTFHGEFEVVAERVVGQRHLKLALRHGDRVVDAIAFNREPFGGDRIRSLYRLGINDYSGIETLQLVLEDIDTP